jgi:hypothetical protein
MQRVLHLVLLLLWLMFVPLGHGSIARVEAAPVPSAPMRPARVTAPARMTVADQAAVETPGENTITLDEKI